MTLQRKVGFSIEKQIGEKEKKVEHKNETQTQNRLKNKNLKKH